jgi:hypothetical protein
LPGGGRLTTDGHGWDWVRRRREANRLSLVPNVLEVPAYSSVQRGTAFSEHLDGSVYGAEGRGCCRKCLGELYGWANDQNIGRHEGRRPPEPGEAVRQGVTLGLARGFGVLLATGLDRLVHGGNLTQAVGGGEAEMEC